MFIENDIAELTSARVSMIKKLKRGFVQWDIISMAFIKMYETGIIYEKGLFANLMYGCVRDAYRKTLAINHPVNLDGTIYQRLVR